MVRFGSLLVLVVAALFIFNSCSKKGEDCPFLAPKMVFVGFTENETDTLIIRRYEKTTQFNHLVDTVLIPKASLTRTLIGTDSLVLSYAYKTLNNEFYAYNWELYFPGAARTIPITGITPRFTQEQEASAQCQSYSSIVTFDGRKYVFSTWFVDTYKVFANK